MIILHIYLNRKTSVYILENTQIMPFLTCPIKEINQENNYIK